MNVSSSEIDAYLLSVTPRRDPILTSMEKYARQHGFPIIGPLVGRLLFQMATISGARRILEFGSGYGYSAYWFALAIGKEGRITMTDTDQDNRERAMKYFGKGKLKTSFEFHIGDALEHAKKLKGRYDIILNDIDKEDYPKTIEFAARLLCPGGLFITDNIIWSGRVMDRSVNDAATRGVRRFTKMLYGDRRFFTTIVPIRDGVTLAVRRK